MAKRVMTGTSKRANDSCNACHGFGSIRMTAHFHSGDSEFEAPCWECFGTDVKMLFPHPRTADNG